MAGVRGYATTAAVTCSASTAKTILQLVAAANHRVIIKGVLVGFAGVTAADPPALVEIMKQTTAGTMTGLTTVKVGDYGETLQTTANHTATVDPTTTDCWHRTDVHTQGGW